MLTLSDQTFGTLTENQICICTRMFITALFVIAKKRKLKAGICQIAEWLNDFLHPL